jgi:hypothetical protein
MVVSVRIRRWRGLKVGAAIVAAAAAALAADFHAFMAEVQP